MLLAGQHDLPPLPVSEAELLVAVDDGDLVPLPSDLVSLPLSRPCDATTGPVEYVLPPPIVAVVEHLVDVQGGDHVPLPSELVSLLLACH